MIEIKKGQLHRLYFNKKMTLEKIGKRYHISHSAVAKKMDKYGIRRRNASEAAYVHHNRIEYFQVNTKANELLKDIGLMLYWCEGTNYIRKDKNNGTLAFTNTNADMLKIWIKFLKKVCSLNETKIKIRLHIHKNQNGQKLKKYWSNILKIPLTNFENVSYTKKNSIKPEYKGTIKIRVHNIKLYGIIKNMISETVAKALNI